MENDSLEQISADFPFEKRKVSVLGVQMAYIDIGASSGSATVFLHGNPTSSYLWRNILPHVSGKSRCIAPDLIGFGDSDKIKGLAYRVADHQRYLRRLPGGNLAFREGHSCRPRLGFPRSASTGHAVTRTVSLGSPSWSLCSWLTAGLRSRRISPTASSHFVSRDSGAS